MACHDGRDGRNKSGHDEPWFFPLIPAQAGTQIVFWVPAFAGTSGGGLFTPSFPFANPPL
jgi:hypothetical protein